MWHELAKGLGVVGWAAIIGGLVLLATVIRLLDHKLGGPASTPSMTHRGVPTRTVTWKPAIVVAVAAIGMGVYTLNERRHVALDASGDFWCTGEVCGVRVCGDCTTTERAACHPASLVMGGEDFRQCRTSMSGCEASRERSLADRDVEGVGSCRVVSATSESRDSYNEHVAIVWALVGLLLVLLLGPAIRSWWLRGAPAHP